MKTSSIAALGLLSFTLAANAVVFYPDSQYENLGEAVAAAAASTPDEEIWIVSDGLDEVFPSIPYDGWVRNGRFFFDPLNPFLPIDLPAQFFPAEFAGTAFTGFRFRMLEDIPTPQYEGEFGCTVAASMTFVDCQFVGVLANTGGCGVYGDRALTVEGGTVALTNCRFDNEKWAVGGCDQPNQNAISDSYLKIQDLNANTAVTVQNPTWSVSPDGFPADVDSSRVLVVKVSGGYTLNVDFVSGNFPHDVCPAIKVVNATGATFESVVTAAAIHTFGSSNTFTDCIFNNCQLWQRRGHSTYDGCTYTNSVLLANGSHPKMRVKNSEFYGSSIQFSTDDHYEGNYIKNCLIDGQGMPFAGISLIGVSGGQTGDLFCNLDRVTVVNCGSPFDPPPVLIFGPISTVGIKHSIFWNTEVTEQVNWSAISTGQVNFDPLNTVRGGANGLTGQGQIPTPLSADPLFCDPAGASTELVDYALRWDSPCQDLIPIQGEDLAEFDLTPMDLGWKELYLEEELSSLDDDVLVRGNYKISATRTLSYSNLRIQDGAVIKVLNGAAATLWSTSQAFSMGHSSGQRTALVTPTGASQASSLRLRGSFPMEANLHGILFNNTPSTYLQFNNLVGVSLDPAEPNITFLGSKGCQLQVISCEESEISGFEFQTRQSQQQDVFSTLILVSGSGSAHDNTFRTATTSSATLPPLRLAATTFADVRDNVFDCNPFATTTACWQTSGVVQYRNNQFQSGRSTQLDLDIATAKLGYDAKNAFHAVVDGIDAPLISMDGGSLDMECGINQFVNADANITTAPFVQAINYTNGNRNWMKNYWEGDEPGSISCEELALGYVPSWADASNCLVDPVPPVYLCSPTGEPFDLWTEGNEYLVDEEFLNAIWLFKELIRIYPKDPNTPDATELLKAYGKKSSDFLEPAKVGLLQGAASSLAVEDTWLSATQYSYAQCVEAYFGDREGAVALLDSCYDKWDAKLKDIATLALLEIETYPAQGGNSAMAANGMQSRIERIQRAVDAIVHFTPTAKSEQSPVSSPLPADFKLGQIFPNPFNPSTRIQLLVAKEAQVDVSLYNVLGQRVMDLHSGPLAAGQHELLLDGSKLASGVYVVHAMQGNQVQTAKVLLLK